MVFNIIEFLGTVGGILEILKIMFQIIAGPFAKFSFTLDAI